MKTIMSVDAGFTATGWAILRNGEIVDAGCIRTEPTARKKAVRVSDDDCERGRLIARGLAEIINKYEVGGLIAELPTGGAKAARAISCMARAAAIVATVSELLKIPSEWVTPQAVKKIAGANDASKKAVEAVVLMRWPTAPLPKLKCEREHVADALGAYLAAEFGTLVRVLNAPEQEGA